MKENCIFNGDYLNVFFTFEEENNLYSIKDEKGTYVWDVVRFYVYEKVVADIIIKGEKKRNCRFYLHLVSSFFMWVKALFVKRECFFLLQTRNKKNGKLYDKSSWNIINSLEREKVIAVESYNKTGEYDYDFLTLRSLPTNLLKPFVKIPQFNFQPIIDVVKSEYPHSNITEKFLKTYYERFYCEKHTYKFFFARWGIKKCFYVLNDLHKGLISACQELNIPCFELQHGIVERYHLGYSYPSIDIASHSYMPNMIFSFSPFWFSDIYMPKTKVVPVGNDEFYIQPSLYSDKAHQRIVVISNSIMGPVLADFILDCIKDDFFMGYHFLFKLHPQQFSERKKYEQKFKTQQNIKVITDEYDMSYIVGTCENMLLIHSTAAFEMLQGGGKVFILNSPGYTELERIFDEKNVYLINNIDNFKEGLLNKKNNDTPLFFDKFNKKIFGKSINRNLSYDSEIR